MPVIGPAARTAAWDRQSGGNPVLKTPELDKLHAESVRLTDYHVSPTCAPTRGALMSGHFTISTNAPHGPFHCPDKYWKPYVPKLKNVGKRAETVAVFYGMIANIDENVGKMRAWLEEKGVADNTIFIFMVFIDCPEDEVGNAAS